MKHKITYLSLALLAVGLLSAASSHPDREVAQALKEQNEQLNRIATSLEIIAAQRGNWKLPRN
jgi:hypothetical protein